MQQKIMAGGTGVIIFGLFLRFFIGPATMTIGSFLVGLHGNVLRASILQVILSACFLSSSNYTEYIIINIILKNNIIFREYKMYRYSLNKISYYFLCLNFMFSTYVKVKFNICLSLDSLNI